MKSGRYCINWNKSVPRYRLYAAEAARTVCDRIFVVLLEKVLSVATFSCQKIVLDLFFTWKEHSCKKTSIKKRSS